MIKVAITLQQTFQKACGSFIAAQRQCLPEACFLLRELADNMVFHQGQQYLKYQFMMTQTERECSKSYRTCDNKCMPIPKARGDPGFRGFKFIKPGSIN